MKRLYTKYLTGFVACMFFLGVLIVHPREACATERTFSGTANAECIIFGRLYKYVSGWVDQGVGICRFTNTNCTSLNYTDATGGIYDIYKVDALGGDDVVKYASHEQACGTYGGYSWRIDDTMDASINGKRWLTWGGDGDDTILGCESTSCNYYWVNGDTRADGRDDDDYIYGTPNDDTMWGGNGNDRLWGYGGGDTMYGGNGTDYMYGGDGDDSMNGDADNDCLYGQAGTDTLLGGTGTCNLVDGGAGTNYCSCNVSGSDSVEYYNCFTHNYCLTGSSCATCLSK